MIDSEVALCSESAERRPVSPEHNQRGLPVYFPLKVLKTIQATGVLLRSDCVQRMNYMRLLKLLYLADRESLSETGRPITGGPVTAMERGPVLEEVYLLIRGQHREMPLWDSFFQKDRYDLVLVCDPDVGKLSKYEISKLQEIAKRHEDMDEWDLVQFTHDLPEWKRNDPGSSSKPIPLANILEAVGRASDVEAVSKEAQSLAMFDRLLGK
jgi:uncharacterized phage-associated protein